MIKTLIMKTVKRMREIGKYVGRLSIVGFMKKSAATHKDHSTAISKTTLYQMKCNLNQTFLPKEWQDVSCGLALALLAGWIVSLQQFRTILQLFTHKCVIHANDRSLTLGVGVASQVVAAVVAQLVQVPIEGDRGSG